MTAILTFKMAATEICHTNILDYRQHTNICLVYKSICYLRTGGQAERPGMMERNRERERGEGGRGVEGEIECLID